MIRKNVALGKKVKENTVKTEDVEKIMEEKHELEIEQLYPQESGTIKKCKSDLVRHHHDLRNIVKVVELMAM
jgi:hypothetical protein